MNLDKASNKAVVREIEVSGSVATIVAGLWRTGHGAARVRRLLWREGLCRLTTCVEVMVKCIGRCAARPEIRTNLSDTGYQRHCTNMRMVHDVEGTRRTEVNPAGWVIHSESTYCISLSTPRRKNEGDNLGGRLGAPTVVSAFRCWRDDPVRLLKRRNSKSVSNESPRNGRGAIKLPIGKKSICSYGYRGRSQQASQGV